MTKRAREKHHHKKRLCLCEGVSLSLFTLHIRILTFSPPLKCRMQTHPLVVFITRGWRTTKRLASEDEIKLKEKLGKGQWTQHTHRLCDRALALSHWATGLACLFVVLFLLLHVEYSTPRCKGVHLFLSVSCICYTSTRSWFPWLFFLSFPPLHPALASIN